MPIGRISPSARGKAAIAGVLMAAGAGGFALWKARPDAVPPAVRLAVDHLIKPWEGLELRSYQDQVGVWTICWGETQGVRPGMTKTKAECDEMLIRRVVKDYYQPIRACIAGFDRAPVSVQASAISGAYNFGVGGMCGSRTAAYIRAGEWRAACEAQTAWNKAGGRIVNGLIKRREMGDAQRIGEAELCVSGL